MEFANEESRLLFLKYALPCANTLVKRNIMSKKIIEDLRENVSNNKAPKNSERIFKTANLMCKKTAQKLGKKFIDKNVVRKYFLFEHDKVVDKRYKMFMDFNTLLCRTYAGKVLDIKNGKAIVKTLTGRRKYNAIFTPNLKIEDNVVVHRSFVVEKVSEKLAKRLWKLKENYFKSNKAY